MNLDILLHIYEFIVNDLDKLKFILSFKDVYKLKHLEFIRDQNILIYLINQNKFYNLYRFYVYNINFNKNQIFNLVNHCILKPNMIKISEGCKIADLKYILELLIRNKQINLLTNNEIININKYFFKLYLKKIFLYIKNSRENTLDLIRNNCNFNKISNIYSLKNIVKGYCLI
jgi:hypothetical protein